ncbi:MAG: hypothetical protein N838_10900 [Thiohalocapsa sp. PB-PSB1]|nr:MAG: hypothetical protein N838_10900 [Thiohalocapsa sp. PB-PSB1]
MCLFPAQAFAESEPAAEDAFAGYNRALSQTTLNGQITGAALVTTCRTGRNGEAAANNQRFQLDCGRIILGANTDQTGSLQALTDLPADQISAQNSVAVRSTNLGVSMIQSRLAMLRIAGQPTGQPAANPSTLLAADPMRQPASGGAASGDLSIGRLGGFLNARYVTGNADQTEYQPGYDFDGWSILGGLDYRFEDNLIGGVSVRYADGKSDYDSNRGDLDGNSWGLSLYASYTMDNGLFIDGLFGYAQNDYTMKRNIAYTTGEFSSGGQQVDAAVATQVAKSDPNADVWNFNIGAGYTLYRDEWSITPSLRLNYLQNDVDSYRETMSNPLGVGGSMALAIDSQTFTSFTSDLGVQVARAISTESGVWVPQLRIGWVHEFENSQEEVGARFINDIDNQPFFVATQTPVRDYADLSVGVSAQFAGGRSAFISYNTLLGYNDVTYNAVNAGVRLEF